jgi:hypothetical protein
VKNRFQSLDAFNCTLHGGKSNTTSSAIRWTSRSTCIVNASRRRRRCFCCGPRESYYGIGGAAAALSELQLQVPVWRMFAAELPEFFFITSFALFSQWQIEKISLTLFKAKQR